MLELNSPLHDSRKQQLYQICLQRKIIIGFLMSFLYIFNAKLSVLFISKQMMACQVHYFPITILQL